VNGNIVLVPKFQAFMHIFNDTLTVIVG
jgi:hypothetical protein